MVKNIATDDGSDPDSCTEVSDDCSGTITPMDAETTITKKLVSEDGELEGLAESGETLTFEIDIRNITAAPAELVLVRDSLVENAAETDWITYNGIIATNPAVLATTGSLEDGTYTINEVLPHSTVKIFYTITLGDIPSDVSEVANIATDNGQDPTDPELICDDNPRDCDLVVVPVNPDTIINKTAVTDSGDLVVTEGEAINYTISVNNPSSVVANDVQVIDSLLSALPTYVTLGTITIQNGAGDDLVIDTDYTGDLTTTDGIVINEIAAGDTITITYSITLDEIPEDGVVNIRNVVTDDGSDPSIITPEIDCDEDGDCGQVIVPIDPETIIEKEIIAESMDEDFIAQEGEELTYQVTVINPTDALALDVEVKDSLLEKIESTDWLSLVGDITIVATPDYTMETSGDLQTGDFVISEIPGKTEITITYTVLVGEIPDGTTEIPNVVTDNGDDPDTIDPEICNPTVDNGDCGAVVIPTNPDTTIVKELTAESIETNSIAEVGETLTYTLNVTNTDTENPALDVEVRDSVVEAIISGDITYLSFDGFTVTPDTITYSTTPSGMISIDEIPADSTVSIEYKITVLEIPEGVLELDNIATDNGEDPTDPETCTDEGDCSEVVVPTNPDTIIEKTVDSGSDNLAQVGETLTFTLKVTNTSDQDTASTPVRDSLIEGIEAGDYPYLKYNDDAEITGVTYDATASGDLADGSYMINSIPAGQYAEITYSIDVIDIPNDVAEIANIATDNGGNPTECTEISTDCSGTITPVDPETTITKEVNDTDDGIVQTGEELTYTIVVTNPNTEVPAIDVVVRDSVIENLPSYITFVSEEVAPTGTTSSGTLTSAPGLTIDEVPAGGSVTITVKVTVDEIPNDVDQILNVVTDNGQDPTDPEVVDPTDPEVCIEPTDCDTAVIPVEPETVIKKEISNETGSEDGIIENGETIEYTISVNNPGANSAYDVAVRDSLVENLPTYANYDGNLVLTVDGTELVLDTDYTGDLSSKDLVINEIAAGETVEITYSITFDVIPNDVSEIGNLAVDTDVDPTDPEIVDPELCDQTGAFTDDCSEVVVPVHPETIVTKTADAGEDNIVQEGEEVLYSITIENPSVVDATDVQVIDSLLADLPDYMELTTPIVVTGEEGELVLDTDYTGDLTTADGIVINQIAAGSVITITYGLTLNDVPESGVIDIANIVTDNGQDPSIVEPEICEDEGDCSEVVIPVDPDTTITKEITDESIAVDNQAQQGEELTYTIVVTNPTDADAIDVEVKDSILANLPAYLTLVGDIVVTPDTVATTGSLTTDDFVIPNLPANSSVTITYTLLVGDVPSDLTEIENIATDNGQDPTTVDPEVCAPDGTSEDCATDVIPTNPETVIEKAKTDESIDVNGIAEPGETITYEIRVTNENDSLSALDVPVRDSLIEEITNGDYPDYTYDGILSTAPDPLASKGDLTTGDYTIDSIEPGETVVIEYTITLADPFTQTDKIIGNIVTDNGGDPIGICPPTSEDCAQVIVPKEPDTIITKSVTDENDDSIAQQGEILTYTVALENTTLIPAENVHVRDSLLEDMPAYLELVDGSFTVDPADTGITGDMETGFIVDHVDAGEVITFTYQVKVLDVPDDVEDIINIVTDDATDPTECTEISSDCGGTITPLEPETVIEKTVKDASGDGAVQTGEELTYEIKVTNTHDSLSALDVEVRDSIIENLPTYMTLVSETYTPEDLTSSGTLATGGITFDEIPADTTVVITVVVTVDEIPDSLDEILNIATDNGIDPETVDPETCLPDDETAEDCGTAVIPVDPETEIVKSVTDSNGDGTVEDNDTLTYTIGVTNPGSNTALDVEVKDSLVEEINAGKYDWLTYGADLTIAIDGTDLVLNTDYTGDLSSSDLVIAEIPAGATATITFTINVGIIPDDVTEIANVVTDNGSDPIDPETNLPIICPEDSEDCDEATLPTNPNTVISKEVTVSGEDQIASIGDDLTFTIAVQNIDDIDALNVPVKDSLLPTLPNEYAELNGEIVLTNGTDTLVLDTDYTGDLQTTDGIVISNIPAGTTVEITYTITMIDVPTDLETVINIATDDGTDPETLTPETCEEDADDCASTITPVDPETLIEKSISLSGDDEFVSTGEDITYTIDVTNPNESATAVDVVVRDSMLETLATDYPYLSFVSETVTPGTLSSEGSLLDSGITIAEIEAGQTATITVVLHVDSIPDDVSEILNVVTDNGQDPTDPELCDEDSEDCDSVTEPVDADTKIEKLISTESIEDDGLAEKDEIITYMLKVTNDNTDATAYDIPVKDSMYQDMPSELELVSEFIVNPTSVGYSGDLADGSLVLDELAPGQTAIITYQVKVNVINESAEFPNIATDNGQDPTDPEYVCDEDSEDCAEVVLPIKPDTTIEKSIIDETIYVDNMIEDGETITYRLTVENISSVDSLDTPVRDNVLEVLDTPEYSWLTLGSVTVNPTDTNYSGSLEDGTFVVDVPALSTVTIDYELTAGEVPSEEKAIENIATDDGTDPALCSPVIAAISDDCAFVKVPVSGDTEIAKALIDESVDNNQLAELGEELTYQLTISNNKDKDAYDVEVRDSLLENTPSWLSVESIEIDTPNSYSGDIQKGTLTLDKVDANSEVTITYVLKVNELPTDVETIDNIATDNGQDPNVIDPEVCAESPKDCAEVVEPIEGDTTIEKNVMSTEDTYYPGDVIEYQLVVSNDTVNSAYDVPVRDSLLENTPDFVKYNGDIEVKGANGSGNITKGTFSLDEVPANSKVYISYSLTLTSDPEGATLLNVATDDGVDPSTVDPVEPEGKEDKDDAIVEVGSKDEDPDYKDMTLGQTGAKGMLILIDMILILGVATILKKRIA